MQMAYWGLPAAKATTDEKVEREIPEHLRKEAIQAIPFGTPEHDAAVQARYFQEHMAKSRVKKQEQAKSGLSIYERARRYR